MAKQQKRNLSYLPQRISQLVIITLGKIFLQPFTRVHAAPELRELARQTPYLIIANHRRAVDPFVICSSLPFKTCAKLLPIGFITHNVFYDSPLRPLLWLMGCYPAKPPKASRSLAGIDASLNLISCGYSICIFPEGTRVRNAARGEARWGVIKIHHAAPKLPVLLAHIEYHRGFKAWLRFHRRTVSYKLIEQPKFADPESIMNAIYAL